MTKLNGTEKQIEWANAIRDTMLNGYKKQGYTVQEGIAQLLSRAENDLNDYREYAKDPTEKITDEEISSRETRVLVVTELKSEIENNDSAAWFIDHKAPMFLTNEINKRS